MTAQLNDVGFLVETDDQLADLARAAPGACFCWVRITELYADGRAQAWAGAGPRGTRFAGPPLILELPDMALVRQQITCPATVSLQITAFAHAAECFPDDTAYRLWQESRPTPMSPECFIPSGAFAQPPRPEAAFAGRIEQARLRTNPATGRPIHHLRVKTGIGTVDVVADPGNLDGIAIAGGIVQGYFSLSGRIVALG